MNEVTNPDFPITYAQTYSVQIATPRTRNTAPLDSLDALRTQSWEQRGALKVRS